MRKAAQIFRWIARVTSVLSIGLIVAILIGEKGALSIGWQEWVLLVFFPAGVIGGMVLGWWKEILGGGLAIAALGLFYGIHRLWYGFFPEGPYFALLSLPGLLFLFAGILRRRGGA